MANLPLIVGSPGVYRIENNNTTQILPLNTTIGAIVFASKRGPIPTSTSDGVTTNTSPNQFTSNYGPSDLTWSYGQVTGLAILNNGKNLKALRVVNTDALHAGATIFSANSVVGTAYIKAGIAPQLEGTQFGFDGGERSSEMIFISSGSSFVSGAVYSGITLSLTGSLTASVVTSAGTAVAATQQAAIAAIAATVNTAISTINTSASAVGITGLAFSEVVDVSTEVFISAPEGCQLAITGGTITSIAVTLSTSATAANGATTLVFASTTGVADGQPVTGTNIASLTTVSSFTSTSVVLSVGTTGTITNGEVITFSNAGLGTISFYNPTIADVFASNPGTWADDYGFNITNINVGTNQVVALQFSESVVSGNTISVTLNIGGVDATATQTYSTNNDSTLGSLATALAAALETASTYATVSVVAANPAGSASGFTELVITAPTPADDYIIVATDVPNPLLVTSGASQATISYVEQLAGVAPDKTFNFNVFSAANLSIPLETFLVSLNMQVDAFGNQQFIENVVNDPNTGSQIVRVAVDPRAVGRYFTNTPFNETNLSGAITFLDGGADGSLPSDVQIAAAWQVFTNTEKYPLDLLVNAGYTSTLVRQTIANIAATRQDCFFILDTPLSAISTDGSGTGEIYDRTNVMNINTSYGAAYTPWAQITDTATDLLAYVPPSGFIADRFIFTDLNYGFYNAPAGKKRGVLPVQDLNIVYSKPIRDLLDAVQLNALRKFQDGSGIIIWGDNTLSTIPSLLSAVNVRRCITIIENQIAAGLENEVFDLNNPSLQLLITQQCNAVMKPIKDAGGINNFLTVCNSSNNPPNYADAGQLNVSIYIIPNRAAKIILLDTEITPSSVTFNEVVVNGTF